MARRRSQTLMQKIFADAEDRRSKAFYYVAKEVTGRAISRAHKQKDKKFNWKSFGEAFDKEYSNYSADELLTEILENVYWLTSESEVLELYFRYMKDLEKNSSKQKETQNNNDLDFS